MTSVPALAGQSKVGCISQGGFAKAGTKTHSQRGAALDRNGLSVSTETACRVEPKSPVGNSEICRGIPNSNGEPIRRCTAAYARGAATEAGWMLVVSDIRASHGGVEHGSKSRGPR